MIQNVGTEPQSIYSETHTAMTNKFGLINLEIGRGTAMYGTFNTIDWSKSTYIQISLNVYGGTEYQVMG